MTTARIEVFPTADEAARAAARLLAEHVRARHHVALAGGSTPRAAYRHAVGIEDWREAVLWFGDDRAVPPGHEHSNFGMVQGSLLRHIPQDRRPRVERIAGEQGAEAAAEDYDARFKAGCPRLHLALMGLGPDAHTASLFPGDPALEERERAAVAVLEPGLEPRVPRVTLTLPVFDAADQVVFLVAGAEKREAVRRAFGSQPDPTAPAALIRSEVVVLCDEAAAP